MQNLTRFTGCHGWIGQRLSLGDFVMVTAFK